MTSRSGSPNLHGVRRRLARRLTLGFLVGAAALAGCQLFLNTDTEQCSQDSDCATQGAGFANRTCSSGICVAPAAALVDGASLDGAGGCSKDACCSNVQCSADLGNHPALCREPGKPCVDLLGGDLCKYVDGKDYTDPNAIFVGTALQFNDSDPLNREISDIAYKTIKLAVDEVNSRGTGLPPVAVGGPRRPIVLVSCDAPTASTELTGKALDHLTKTVGIKAFIGPLDEGNGVAIASQYLIPNNVFLACPYCTSSQFSGLNPPGAPAKVFSTHPPGKGLAAALARSVADVEPEVRAAYGIAGDVKVALITSGYIAQYLEVGDQVEADPGFVWNGGKTKAQNATAGAFIRRTYTAANFLTLLNETVALAPHIIIMVGGLEVPLTGVKLIDGQLGDAPIKPYYITNDGPYAASAIGALANTKYRRRFRGVWPAKSAGINDAYQNFVSRFNAQSPSQNPVGLEGFYDATYLSLLALATTKTATPSAADVSAGVSRLQPPGVTFPVAPGELVPLLAALEANAGNADLTGTLSHLDYDLNSGTLKPVPYTYWCVTQSGFQSDGGVPEGGTVGPGQLSLSTGRTYEPEAAAWTGTPYNCP